MLGPTSVMEKVPTVALLPPLWLTLVELSEMLVGVPLSATVIVKALSKACPAASVVRT